MSMSLSDHGACGLKGWSCSKGHRSPAIRVWSEGKQGHPPKPQREGIPATWRELWSKAPELTREPFTMGRGCHQTMGPRASV